MKQRYKSKLTNTSVKKSKPTQAKEHSRRLPKRHIVHVLSSLMPHTSKNKSQKLKKDRISQTKKISQAFLLAASFNS